MTILPLHSKTTAQWFLHIKDYPLSHTNVQVVLGFGLSAVCIDKDWLP